MKKGFFLLVFFLSVSSFAFNLTLNLNKGDSYIYTIKKNQAMVMGSKETAYRNNTELNLVFKVNVLKSTESEIKLSFVLQKARLRIVSPLGINEFDTDKVKNYPRNPFLSMLIEMKSLPLYYTFDRKTLKIKGINGFKELQKKVIEKLNFKNKRLKKKIEKSLKEKSKEIEENYGLDLNLFPYLNRDISLGKEFKVTQRFYQGNTKISADVIYTVEKITDKFVFFKINSFFNLPEAKTVFNGVEALSSITGKQTGSLTVYKDSGLANFYSVKQNIEGFFLIKDTGEKFPIKVDSVVIIRFQRVN